MRATPIASLVLALVAIGCDDDGFESDPAPICTDTLGCPEGMACIGGMQCAPIDGSTPDPTTPAETPQPVIGGTSGGGVVTQPPPTQPLPPVADAGTGDRGAGDGGTTPGAGSALCQPEEDFCEGVCRNVLRDRQNCGACGFVCPSGLECELGTCTEPLPGPGL